MISEPTHPRPTLGDTFEPKRNALNAVRLALAVGVIIWHSFPISGNSVEFEPLHQLLENVFVDGFFAISGFLIVSSWQRDPHAGRYLAARAVRIYPAFWVCLLVTAFVVAPIGNALTLGNSPGFPGANAQFVLGNVTLLINEWGIADTPNQIPYEGAWNGSLWTLQWEFACYIAVLLLGLGKLTARRYTFPAVFAACVVATVAALVLGLDNATLGLALRFATVFLAGALIHQFRDRLPINAWMLTAAGALVLAATFLPNYRVLAALPLAYLVIGLGASLKTRALHLRNDISYGTYLYAFPAQQVLACLGAASFGVAAFAALSIAVTLPLAAASWFLIEKPALRLKPRYRQTAKIPLLTRR